MGNIGIKASGTNDVLTATPAQLAFSSAYRHPKIWQSGKISGTSQTIATPFGYPLRTQGYILNGGAYYYYFDREIEWTGNLTNHNYGKIKTDNSNLYLTATSADSLVYVAYVDPAIDLPSAPLSLIKGDIGMKFSKTNDDVLTAADYLKSITSEYKLLKIVQEGNVTVSAQACNAPCPPQIVETTDFVDVNHSLGYAGHIILFGEWGRKSISFLPHPVGFVPPTIFTEEEVSIDTTKIRFRISRKAESGGIGPCSPSNNAAKDFAFHYFLTDYRLLS